MSRFANPKPTKRYVIPGPCACPGQLHDEDWIDVRSEVGAVERLGDSRQRLSALIVGWNLLDFDGTEATIDDDHLDRLFEDLFEHFNTWISKNVRTTAPLPNVSSVPSQNGSRGSASPSQPTPTAT